MSLLNFKNPNAHFKVTVITHITFLNSISKTSYKMYSLSCPMESIILLNLILYSHEAVLKIYCNFLKQKRTFCEPAKTTATCHIQCFCQINESLQNISFLTRLFPGDFPVVCTQPTLRFWSSASCIMQKQQSVGREATWLRLLSEDLLIFLLSGPGALPSFQILTACDNVI